MNCHNWLNYGGSSCVTNKKNLFAQRICIAIRPTNVEIDLVSWSGSIWANCWTFPGHISSEMGKPNQLLSRDLLANVPIRPIGRLRTPTGKMRFFIMMTSIGNEIQGPRLRALLIYLPFLPRFEWFQYVFFKAGCRHVFLTFSYQTKMEVLHKNHVTCQV